ncbi:hypothetical protein [Schinkia azotoformans]|uniref:hypothetical protein n=1 Tax=Schinkia azotoformans TaxID=1454 RepID=UPI002DB7194E|nr:hypothetical protein [Schinkia azotoformans]MEC1772811.1 hypothetical protein [Schinkia azotoformans]MED4367470.1 hypothetical protein [Schinkia azotoformans]
MDKVQIKLTNGESLFLSIAREGHAHFDDIYKQIEDAIEEESIFVKFNTCAIKINEILYVRLVEDDGQNQEKQPDKINPNPNSLFNIKPNEEIVKHLKDGAWDEIQKNIDVNRNIPQPNLPDWSNILKKD